MRNPKSLHNLQNDEGGKYMAETETETVIKQSNFQYNWKVASKLLCHYQNEFRKLIDDK
jgi:hypothetical protein